MPIPYSAHLDRVAEAITAKAIRLYQLAQAPLGSVGEMSEFGMVTVRPDHQIHELLYGLMFEAIPDDLTTLVTSNDVIVRMGHDPDSFPEADSDAIDRALSAACSWVETYIRGGVGIA